MCNRSSRANYLWDSKDEESQLVAGVQMDVGSLYGGIILYPVWIFECHSRLIRSFCRRGAVCVNFPNACGSSCVDSNVQSTSLDKDVYHTWILI